MRISRLSAAAAAGAAALAGATPAFAGTGTGQVIVSPTTVMQGQKVQVTGTCPNNGGKLMWVGSSAFMAGMNDAYSHEMGNGGSAQLTSSNPMNWSGWATISKHAKPGMTTVAARCGRVTITVRITVVVRRGNTPMPRMSTTMRPSMGATGMPSMGSTAMPSTGSMQTGGQVGMMPSGAPNTGAASTDSGMGHGYAAAGIAGALLFGAGAGGLMLRRRARARR